MSISLAEFLPFMSLGLWVGVFFVFVCKLLNHVIEIFLRIFKQA